MFWGGWAALVPQIQSGLALTDQQLGSALFTVPVAALPSMLFTGWLVKRWAQRTLPLVTVVFAVGCLLVGLAPTMPALVAALLVVGAASGAIEVALNASVAAHEASTGRRLFNKVHAVTPLAMVLAAPAVGLARQLATPSLAIVIVIAVLVGLSAALAVNGPAGEELATDTTSGGMPWRVSGPVLVLGCVGAIVLMMENAVEQWSALHLEQQLGAGPLLASLGPAGYMAGLSVGRILTHWRGDRLTERTVVLAGGLLGATGLILGAVSPHPALVLAGFSLAGIGLAPVIPTLLGVAGRRTHGQYRSAAISLITTVSYAGFLTSPLLMGVVAGWWGLSTALAVAAAGGLFVAAGSSGLVLLRST